MVRWCHFGSLFLSIRRFTEALSFHWHKSAKHSFYATISLIFYITGDIM